MRFHVESVAPALGLLSESAGRSENNERSDIVTDHHRPNSIHRTAIADSGLLSFFLFLVFTCVSYAEARNRYRLDVCLSVRLSVCHTLVLYQND